MNFRRFPTLLLTAVLACALAGCHSLDKQKDKITKPAGTLADQNGEPSFQAFLSRLRKAAAKKDVKMLAIMMTADFGYSWAPGGEGPGVFQYWDVNGTWPELNLVLRDRFVPSGDYMVAPEEVTTNPDYKGFRAGLRLVNGSWRFAYFVPAPPANLKP